ncbi:hypothetical protein NECID01_0627 [Nematocida sp. AWRm77]|nr:hypothetical protein NECID01_0627 [Nematocida sp. AWRm77]
MKYLRILAFATAVACMSWIRVGVDDSMLNTTLSVERINITTETVQKNVFHPKGVKIERQGVKLDTAEETVYFPLMTIMEKKEEVEKRYPFIKVAESPDQQKVFQFRTLYTDIPETFVYGEYIGQRISSQRKKKESIAKVYATARGYATPEQFMRIGEAICSSVATKEVEVLPDGTSLALQYLAPGKVQKNVQVYVFRGDKLVVSLFNYRPKKEGVQGGKLKSIYHEVFDVYNEMEIYTRIAEYVQNEVLKIVQHRKPEIKKEDVEFYPRVGNEPVRKGTHSYNIIDAMSKAVLGLNNGFNVEDNALRLEEIVLESGNGERTTIVPQSGSECHHIPLKGLQSIIEEYITDKKEKINEAINTIREKNKAHEKDMKQNKDAPQDPEEIVYNDIFLPKVFEQLMQNVAFSKEAVYMKKTNLSEGGVQAAHWDMTISDAAAKTVRGSGRTYKLNGKSHLYSGVKSMLSNELAAEKTIVTILAEDIADAAHNEQFKNFSAEEKQDLEKSLKEIQGQMSLFELKKSPKMVEAIKTFFRIRDTIDQRAKTVELIKQKIPIVLSLITEGEEACKETQEAIPTQAVLFQMFLSKKSEEIKALETEIPSSQVLKVLNNMHNALNYRIQALRKEHDKYLDAKREEEEKKKEKEKQQGEEKEAPQGETPILEDAQDAEKEKEKEGENKEDEGKEGKEGKEQKEEKEVVLEAPATEEEEAQKENTADDSAIDPALGFAKSEKRQSESKRDEETHHSQDQETAQEEETHTSVNTDVIEKSMAKEKSESFDSSIPSEKASLAVDL